MKCLSLWQPWATLIAIGAKRIETRHWSTNYRGPLAIHAAKRDGMLSRNGEIAAFKAMKRAGIFSGDIGDIRALPHGAFVCICRLDDCCATSLTNSWNEQDGSAFINTRYGQSRVEGDELLFGDYSPGRFGWLLSERQPLRSPIPYRGLQNLFTVPDELFTQPPPVIVNAGVPKAAKELPQSPQTLFSL